MSGFLKPLLAGDGATRPVLINRRTGRPVATRLETAFDSASRRTGLLQRDGLPEGTALIIAPTNAIHTFFMKFPIDVAFVARDGRVVKARADLAAWRIAAAFGGYAVVEMAAGSLARSDTRVGDLLVVEPAGETASGGAIL